MAVMFQREPMNPAIFDAVFKAQWVCLAITIVGAIALAITDAFFLVWVVVPGFLLFMAGNVICRTYYPEPNPMLRKK